MSAQTAAVLLAAGSGQRLQGVAKDKVLEPLNGKPAFLHVLEAFQQSSAADHYVVTYRDEEQKAALKALAEGMSLTFVLGGARRQDSVFEALKSLDTKRFSHVMIHDVARSAVHPEALKMLAAAMKEHGAAALAHRAIDTIVRSDANKLEYLPRNTLWCMETPQAFELNAIFQAHKHVHASGLDVTDDVGAYLSLEENVHIVENPYPNPKLTRPDDIAALSLLLQQRSSTSCLFG